MQSSTVERPKNATLQVNGERLWQSLMEMAKIGATQKGGCCRITLTDEDKAGRDLFVQWCKDAGCSVEIDEVGNIYARRAGKDNSLPPVMTGSHLDTQPTGGKFDGVYGVLSGLEVIRTLNDQKIETLHPLEVVVWTNEEGTRFAPAMMGSGTMVGKFSLAETLEKKDIHGKIFGEELKRIGYAGKRPAKPQAIHAFFETHIEQGPYLEAEKKEIGVVILGQGQRWYDVSIQGRESHAGPTPMHLRKDALVAAAKMITKVNEIALAHQPYACGTVGFVQVFPNSRNTIPGQVKFSIDFRHPVDEQLTSMDQAIKATVAELNLEGVVEVELKDFWYYPPIAFDKKCRQAVQDAADAFGYSSMEIVSGAAHDACYIAEIAPTGMIFIPCDDGISHNEIENIEPGQALQGCNVLLHAMLQVANGNIS
ncbi:MAG: Zn-dependent hydrolase [Turneriella sp.]|nr:Zn-dependent hydrolase [Turneriella sp.]